MCAICLLSLTRLGLHILSDGPSCHYHGARIYTRKDYPDLRVVCPLRHKEEISADG